MRLSSREKLTIKKKSGSRLREIEIRAVAAAAVARAYGTVISRRMRLAHLSELPEARGGASALLSVYVCMYCAIRILPVYIRSRKKAERVDTRPLKTIYTQRYIYLGERETVCSGRTASGKTKRKHRLEFPLPLRR